MAKENNKILSKDKLEVFSKWKLKRIKSTNIPVHGEHLESYY